MHRILGWFIRPSDVATYRQLQPSPSSITSPHLPTMGKSLNPYEVYASQLIHLGYGHPLWDPEPPKSGPVEIGDVGFVSEGRFHRLFNAIRSQDDPINQGNVPGSFVQLCLPDEQRDFVSHVVNPGEPLCSDSVQKNKFGFGADVPT